MIGVIANSSQRSTVREFFELFKTPWEFYCGDRDYEILVCTNGTAVPKRSAKLVVVYGSRELPIDAAEHVQVTASAVSCVLVGDGMRIPIYKSSATFAINGACILVHERSRRAAMYVANRADGTTVARLGYDLCDEITSLLTRGQPCAHASIPSLELHIAVLRNLIVDSGIRLIEIPPVPNGYRFIACLTHDVDHPSIRRHKFDHTMFGFLYRATIGSFFAVLRRRASVRNLLTNWLAALKLPFVHFGVAKDFWNQLEVYATLEGGVPSSFFVIPFKDRPGEKAGNVAPAKRASCYSAADIADEIRQLRSEGHEVGLHGIDAWHDSSRGRQELEEIRRITGAQEVGVRMHWLYFDRESPAVLESVGVDYDSSVGYNDAVGYRAGTAQVYQPLGTTRLLELPLHIMDTALFFPRRQNLLASEARTVVEPIIDHALRYGGVVTVNWHDRSIAPERLWGSFYVTLIDELKNKGAWLANARQTVQWFRARRAIAFGTLDSHNALERLNARLDVGPGIPGLALRIHNGQDRGSCPHTPVRKSHGFVRRSDYLPPRA